MKCTTSPGAVVHFIYQLPFFFQLEWLSSWKDAHISAKELLPVVVSSALWGSSWTEKILFHWDNMAAVLAINNRSARDHSFTYLFQCLFFSETHFRFEHIHVANHIQGWENIAADGLSHNQLSHFCLLFHRPSSPQLTTTPLPSVLLMDLSSLERFVQSYLACCLAKRTQSSYVSDQKCYLAFCEADNLTHLPLSKSNLCLFSAFLAHEGLQGQRVFSALFRCLQTSQQQTDQTGHVSNIHLEESKPILKQCIQMSHIMAHLLSAWQSGIEDDYDTHLLWAKA